MSSGSLCGSETVPLLSQALLELFLEDSVFLELRVDLGSGGPKVWPAWLGYTSAFVFVSCRVNSAVFKKD